MESFLQNRNSYATVAKEPARPREASEPRAKAGPDPATGPFQTFQREVAAPPPMPQTEPGEEPTPAGTQSGGESPVADEEGTPPEADETLAEETEAPPPASEERKPGAPVSKVIHEAPGEPRVEVVLEQEVVQRIRIVMPDGKVLELGCCY